MMVLRPFFSTQLHLPHSFLNTYYVYNNICYRKNKTKRLFFPFLLRATSIATAAASACCHRCRMIDTQCYIHNITRGMSKREKRAHTHILFIYTYNVYEPFALPKDSLAVRGVYFFFFLTFYSWSRWGDRTVPLGRLGEAVYQWHTGINTYRGSLPKSLSALRFAR